MVREEWWREERDGKRKEYQADTSEWPMIVIGQEKANKWNESLNKVESKVK